MAGSPSAESDCKTILVAMPFCRLHLAARLDSHETHRSRMICFPVSYNTAGGAHDFLTP